MSKAIEQAISIQEVVEIINSLNNDRAVGYAGGTDVSSAENAAAEYALDANKDFDNTEEQLLSHLEYLQSNGAQFDIASALKIAMQ